MILVTMLSGLEHVLHECVQQPAVADMQGPAANTDTDDEFSASIAEQVELVEL
jgi:hypothetical protein